MRLRHVALPLLLALAFEAPPIVAYAQANIGVSITLAPPALPIYAQPALPGDGYLWTPGYWAWGTSGYYWVPGTWIMPPEIGMLWTPGYWGSSGGGYLWHAGYWGQHVGFYGGINYGFGYFGSDYVGGHWQGNAFYYNSAVNNVGSTHVANVYRQTVVNHSASHVSYSGAGGVAARPGPTAQVAAHETHAPATPVQAQHETVASADHRLQATENHGRPVVAATPKAAVLDGPGIEPARAAPKLAAAHIAPATRPTPAARPAEQPKSNQPAAEEEHAPDEHR